MPPGEEDPGRRPDLDGLDEVDADLQALALAMTNPVRTAILAELARKPGLGADELARATGEPAASVRRHLRDLLDAGLVRVAREVSRRGTLKRHYEPERRPLRIDAGQEALLSRSIRVGIALRILREIFGEARLALEAGTFLGRPERVLACTAAAVDGRGWAELAEIQAEALARIGRVCEESAARLDEERGHPVSVCAALLLFEVPARADEDAA